MTFKVRGVTKTILLRTTLAALLAGSGPALAADEAPPPANGQESGGPGAPGEAAGTNVKMQESGLKVRNRWDNGLDVVLTDAFGRKAAEVSAPTMSMTASWNYKFVTNTYLGFNVSGFPQSMRLESEDPTVKRSVTAYWGGLGLGQGLFESWPYRVVLTVTGGKGLVYLRETPANLPSEVSSTKFTFVEPGLFGTFYAYHSLEMGAVVTYRMARVEDDRVAENKDLSSVTYGLTFRTQRF